MNKPTPMSDAELRAVFMSNTKHRIDTMSFARAIEAARDVRWEAMLKQEPVAWPALNQEEHAALERFNETCEDGQEYDVPKAMMQRLSEIGVVCHLFNRVFCITEVGRATLDYSAPQPAQQELLRQALKALETRDVRLHEAAAAEASKEEGNEMTTLHEAAQKALEALE